MENETTTTTTSGYEEVFFSTCAEFLALNLSKSDVESASGGSDNVLLDSCGHISINMTAVSLHPARYAVLIVYPVLLAICTVGNILTVIVLAREGKSVKRIYLMALACSDFFYMWAQFFPYLTSYPMVLDNSVLRLFINQISGSCTFFQEMLITSSDWILVAFSVERFFAVVFPLYYSIFVSKTRAKVVVAGVFVLAALYAVYNLVDYYWFMANDDPRCPPDLIRPPEYLIQWHHIHEWAVLIVPVVTFLVILSVNVAVSVHLVRHKRFLNANAALGCNRVDSVRDGQAIHMLLACAVLYILTQSPAFAYNILQLMRHYPFCAFTMSDNFVANYMRAVGVITNINYSVNFLLYYGVSTSFRQGLRDFRHSVRQTMNCGRYPLVLGKNGVGHGKKYNEMYSNGIVQPVRTSLASCISSTSTTTTTRGPSTNS